MTKIVWICNLSSESFSDGKEIAKPLDERITAMIADGADIIDLWAVSTAPGAPEINEAEELQRVQQALPIIQKFTDMIFSLDTTRASVASMGIKQWITMINDVSGGRADEEMFSLIVATGMQYVMMYCKNDSGKADKQLIIYTQWIVDTVIEFFQTQIAIAAQAGIHREQIILDPGMGAFVSQDPDDSIRLLQAIPLIKKTFDLPIHICTSRKWFLGKLVQLPPWERGVGGDLNLDNWPAVAPSISSPTAAPL